MLGHIVNTCMALAFAGFALCHNLVEMLFFGAIALDQHGHPVIRENHKGVPYYVKEPSLARQLIGIAFGGTIKRDANGVPLTDEDGRYIKDTGWFY